MRGDRIGWGDKEKRAEMVKKWKGVTGKGNRKGEEKDTKKEQNRKGTIAKT